MSYEVIVGDCRTVLRNLPAESVDCVFTSPPYFGLRDYESADQIGHETSRDGYVRELVAVFREVFRVLKSTGTCWINLGDSYNAAGRKGHGTRQGVKQGTLRASAEKKDWVRPSDPSAKPKELLGIPWRVALALSDDGWCLRQDIVWNKPNPMTESVKDRATKAHEYLFMFTKSERYYFNHEGFREPTADGTGLRNRRSVWTVPAQSFRGAHFATFPPNLVRPALLGGCPPGGVVLDPFGGSGTTAGVAETLGMRSIMIEVNPEFAALIPSRVSQITGGPI